MSLAFAVFMPQGVVAYRNHLLLDALGPIMQHGTKHKNRAIHMMLQVCGGRRLPLARAIVGPPNGVCWRGPRHGCGDRMLSWLLSLPPWSALVVTLAERTPVASYRGTVPRE